MDSGLQTIKLSELPEAATLNESDYSFIVQNGTSKKIKGLLLKGNAGDNGKSIEIQKTDTHIQWRQEGGQWINLVALADLKGDKGEQGGGTDVDLTDYATKVWVTQQLASYYTKAEIDLSLSNKANKSDIPSLNGYATETFVTNKIAEAQLSGGEVDLSTYATKEELNNKADKTAIPTKTSDLTNDSGFLTSIPSEYVTEEEMSTALSAKANKSDIPSLEGYATETFVTNNYASKNHNHSEYASSSHRHDASEIDNLPSGSVLNLRDNSPLKIWAGTQEQYDALLSYDETIIYLIEGYVNTNPSEPSSNYSITKNLTNCSLSNSANSITSGSSYESNVSINDGYVLSSISITMGGTNITSSAYSNGSITINSVTGDIVITIVANAESTTQTYTITNNLTNCSNSNSYINIDEGGAYNAVISADSGYELQAVTVTMGGNDVTSTAYSNGNIAIDSVTGNIVITATAVLTSSTEAAYSLDNELILDGSSNVDTGISLFDADKDFTIIADFTPDSSFKEKDFSSKQGCVFRVKQTSSPWIGVDISLYPSTIYSYPSRGDMISSGNKYGWYIGKISTGVHTNLTDRLKFAIKRVASEQKMYFYDSNGLIGSYADSGNVASNTFATTLKIGGYVDGTTQNFVGTVHKFDIYLSQLSNEEITNLLG